jgi:hypothetical protein
VNNLEECRAAVSEVEKIGALKEFLPVLEIQFERARAWRNFTAHFPDNVDEARASLGQLRRIANSDARFRADHDFLEELQVAENNVRKSTHG